jgi:hypothetical protein
MTLKGMIERACMQGLRNDHCAIVMIRKGNSNSIEIKIKIIYDFFPLMIWLMSEYRGRGLFPSERQCNCFLIVNAVSFCLNTTKSISPSPAYLDMLKSRQPETINSTNNIKC